MKKIRLLLGLLLMSLLLTLTNLKANPDVPWNFCSTPKPKSLAGECHGPDQVFCCIDPVNGVPYGKPSNH